MAFFLRVDTRTGKVLGANESSRAPDPLPAGLAYRFLDDAERATFEAARRTLMNDGRDGDQELPTLSGWTAGSLNVEWSEMAPDSASPTGRKLRRQQKLVDCILGGTFAAPADSRGRFSVVLSRAEATIGDAVVLTLTALAANGSTRTTFGERREFWAPDGQRLRLQFLEGVAAATWHPRRSGTLRIVSGRDAWIAAPAVIEVYDA